LKEEFVVCLNCGKLTPQREFCLYCHSPVLDAFRPPRNSEGLLLADTSNGEFRLPLRYLAYHFAFYGVTGTGKTRAAMNLAVRAENAGLCLRVLDVEGEWKRIIPRLEKDVVYFSVGDNLRLNPFDLNDPGLTKILLLETIFMGMAEEYREISPQMSFLLDKCILRSRSIPDLIRNVIRYRPRVPFKVPNIEATRMALLTRLNPFVDNPALREIFNVGKSSIDMSGIDGVNLIVDLHDLDRKVAYKRELRLIYNTLTVAYLREALSKSERDSVENMFIADEAQLLVPRILRKATSTDTWVTTDFATRLRKRGECLVIITQSLSNIEDDIRKNAQNMFIFGLQDKKDIEIIAGMLGYVQVDEISRLSNILTNLENRRAIVKTPMVKHPFIVKTVDVS